MTPAIRSAEPDDVAAIAAIYAHHVRTGLASFELDPPPVDEMRRRYESVCAAGFPYLVAVGQGRVLGYAYASAFRARPAYRFTVEDSVYLDPAAAGRGLGGRLLRALIEACALAGFRQMIAVIGDSANRASIALHRSCGFEQSAVLVGTGFKHGRWVDTVLMQRALADGDHTAPPA
jgi:phosphinothricin acetyltransferase